MQFSETESSSASAASTPRKRGRDKLVVANVAIPPTSAMRAFHATSSSDRRGTDDRGGRQRFIDTSPLRLQLTAGLDGATGSTPGTPSTRNSRNRIRNDDGDDDTCFFSTQQAPPFFAKASAASFAAPAFKGESNRTGVAVTALQMTRSSSQSSTSSQSSISAPNRSRRGEEKSTLHRSTSRILNVGHYFTSDARRGGGVSPQSIESSSSDTLFHPPPAAPPSSTACPSTSIAPHAVAAPLPAKDERTSRTEVMTHIPNHTPSTTAEHEGCSFALKGGMSMASSASTLTNTSYTSNADPSFVDLSASHTLGDAVVSVAVVPEATGASVSGAQDFQPSLASFISNSSGACLPPHSQSPGTQRRSTGHGNPGYSNVDDASADGDGGQREEEDELNTTAGSRAAQAALDAAEQFKDREGHYDASPVAVPTTGHSCSVHPSRTLLREEIDVPLLPQTVAGCRPDARIDSTARDFFTKDKEGNDASVSSFPGNRSADSLHTPSPTEQHLFSRTENSESSRVTWPNVAGLAGISEPAAHPAVPRRQQPPPPPTPSTTRKTALSRSSSLDAGEGSDNTSCDSSHCNTDPTLERQRTPLISFDTHTTTASAEAAQAVVNYSASLLPPTRSRSSDSHCNSEPHSSGSARGGSEGGKEKSALPSAKGAQELVHRVSRSIDSSVSDIVWVHPQRRTTPGGCSALENNPGAEIVDSATMLSSSMTATDMAVSLGGDHVDTGVFASNPKGGYPEHFLNTAPSSEAHGETHTTAAFPTTMTTGGGTLSSRTSVLLMPPSPSQPRAAMSAGNSACSSSLSANADATVLEDSSHRSNSHALRPAQERDASGQSPEGGADQQVTTMQRMTSSSNSLCSPSSSAGTGYGDSELRRTNNYRSEIWPMGERSCFAEEVGDSDRPALWPRAATTGYVAEETNYIPSSNSASSTALDADAVDVEDVSAAYVRSFVHKKQLVKDNDRESEKSVEDRAVISWECAAKGNVRPLALQEAGHWDNLLGEMELVDCTVISRVYEHRSSPQGSSSHVSSANGSVHTDNQDDSDRCLFKVVSLFPVAAEDHGARWSRYAEVQGRLLALAEEMRSTQRALDEAGLTTTESDVRSLDSRGVDAPDATASPQTGRVEGLRDDPDGLFAQRRQRVTCAGLLNVCVDSRCRIIAQLETMSCMVTLRCLLAANAGTGLRENEVVALIRTVVCKVATMHNAGFAHGALHAGNVLISSYDGDAVLTQPCGLMSQSAWLPSDLSVISVTRALAMAPYLLEVWGTHRPDAKSATSSGLGSSPQRPNSPELITYHNLSALGWLGGDVTKRSADSDENTNIAKATTGGAAYIPTAADDLYALGMMAFFILYDTPPFQVASLWAVVGRLGALADDYTAAMQSTSSSSYPVARSKARRLISDFCFGTGRYSSESSYATGSSPSSAEPSQSPGPTTPASTAVQQYSLTPFREEFIQSVQSFIVDCVEASCAAAMLSRKNGCASMSECSPSGYLNAQELLAGHPLFQVPTPTTQTNDVEKTKGRTGNELSMGASEAQSDADEKMRDTVHSVAYPAFCTWSAARKGCGSAPYLSRLHSNAFYTARSTALCERICRGAQEKDYRTVNALKTSSDAESLETLSAYSPQVVTAPRAWWAPLLLLDENNFGVRDRETSLHTYTATSDERLPTPWHWQRLAGSRLAADSAALLSLSALLRPSPVEAPGWLAGPGRDGFFDNNASGGSAARQGLDSLEPHITSGSRCELDKDFVLHHSLPALLLAKKQDGVFSLGRSFLLSRVSPVADTLILQRLTDCTVTLLAPFRYIVLDGLLRCEVRLGPCEYCVLRDVHSCPLIAIAARQLYGTNVTETHLSWSGQGSGRPGLKCSRDVTTSLYGIVYEGLVEDYSRMGLALEHSFCFAAPRDSQETADLGSCRGNALMQRRTFELMATTAADANRGHVEVGLCLAPEAPYAHALILSSTRYVHSGRRSGGPQSPWMASPDVYHFFGELAGKDVVVCDVHGNVQDRDGRPIVFVIGELGDIVVERCSHCTIVVVGTPSNLQASGCHDCQLIYMARESVIEDCTRMECVALVTEYLLLQRCDTVRVRPLFLDCPFSDEVLRCVVSGSIGGSEEEQVVGAYEAGRVDKLNAVLRGVDHGVYVQTCENVTIEDMNFYYSCSSLAGGTQHLMRGDEGARKRGIVIFSVHHASMPTHAADGSPLNDASQYMGEAAESLAELLSLPCSLEPLHRYGCVEREVAGPANRAAVSFHDLLNCSVFRVRGSLCPPELPSSSGCPDVNATLANVCVDRVHGGVIYIEDAVHSLRLRHCAGPLDVVVCAATTVMMEGCVGVQLRTACVSFQATDCAHCHVALHVNDPPQYLRCMSMQTSPLNITAREFEVLLTAARVSLEINLYDTPRLLSMEGGSTREVGRPSPPSEACGVDASKGCNVETPTTSHGIADVCSALLAAPDTEPLDLQNSSQDIGERGVSPSQIPRMMLALRQPVTVVAPLPGLCVSPKQAPFVEELERRVTAWAERPFAVSRDEAVVIALYALADVGDAPLSLTERAELSEPVQHTEPPQSGTGIRNAPGADQTPQLMSTHASSLVTSPSSLTAGDAPRQISGPALQKPSSADVQLESQRECPRTRGSAIAAATAPMHTSSTSSAGEASARPSTASEAHVLSEVAVDNKLIIAEEDSVKRSIMRRSPEPPLSLSPPTRYVDPTQVSLKDKVRKSPVMKYPVIPVQPPQTPPSNLSLTSAQADEGGFLDSAASPPSTSTAGFPFATGLHGIALVTEIGTSVNSSSTPPPPTPGATRVLDPTQAGASSTVDVFSRTQVNGVSVVTGSTHSAVEEDSGRQAATTCVMGNVGLRSTSLILLPDHCQSPVMAGGSTGSCDESERSGKPPTPADEPSDAFARETQVQWPSSPQESSHRLTPEGRKSGGGAEPIATVVLREEGRHHVGNIVTTSSSSSSCFVDEYPRRSQGSYEGSTQSGADEDNGDVKGLLSRPPTNFVHVSQDSLIPQQGSFPATAAGVMPSKATGAAEGDDASDSGVSMKREAVQDPQGRGCSMMPHTDLPGKTLGQDAFATHGADMRVHDLIRRVEQARQIYARRQHSWTSSASSSLETRVQATVLKLRSLKNVCSNPEL